MSENNPIKKMVSSILRGRKNASFDRHIMHPEREWFASVFIGLALFATGIAWNISTHLHFKNAAISSDPVAEEAVVYRAGLVESALTDFAVRRQQYEDLKQEMLPKVVVPEVTPVETEVEDATTTDEVTEPAPVDQTPTESTDDETPKVLMVI